MRKENQEHIEKIKEIVAHVVSEVGNFIMKSSKELEIVGESADLPIKKVIPNAFQIAEYYGIKIVRKDLKGEISAYFNRELSTIFVSNIYDSYEEQFVVAHELGHFFADDSPLSALNDDVLNRSLPSEMIKEYEANVFAILLMPQIMRGKPWRDYSPGLLNRRVYLKLFKQADE